MNDAQAPAKLTLMSPFFIVRDIAPSIAFYRDALGFQLAFQAPGDDPFFAILRRDGAQLMIKAVAPEVPPLPNSQRHPWAPWDAFIHSPDPDALATEFLARGDVVFFRHGVPLSEMGSHPGRTVVVRREKHSR
jgi:catechol 2,3-dioxygenase-like lactoylglutathione lyase family enzyme